jgi:hypothetical protein
VYIRSRTYITPSVPHSISIWPGTKCTNFDFQSWDPRLSFPTISCGDHCLSLKVHAHSCSSYQTDSTPNWIRGSCTKLSLVKELRIALPFSSLGQMTQFTSLLKGAVCLNALLSQNGSLLFLEICLGSLVAASGGGACTV